jgi:large subunit ribosomal protein L25
VIDWAGPHLLRRAPDPERGVRRLRPEAPEPHRRTENTMSAPEKIAAESRTEFGKGAARRIRREDKIPAVVYGHGNETIHLTLPGHATMMALKHGGANALLELDIDGTEQLVLSKQVQVDPLRRVLEHIDFVAVRRGEKVTVDVPIHTVGAAAPETLVVTENSTVQVEAEATHIPEYIEVDIEGAQAGTQILASQLVLPEGTTLIVDPDTLVINVTQERSAEEVEAELAEAEAEVGIVHEATDEEVEAAAAEAAEGAEGEAGEGAEAAPSEGGDEE